MYFCTFDKPRPAHIFQRVDLNGGTEFEDEGIHVITFAGHRTMGVEPGIAIGGARS